MKANETKLVAQLFKIREACSIATSQDDSNMNLIVEEIDRMAAVSIAILEGRNPKVTGNLSGSSCYFCLNTEGSADRGDYSAG